jgi:hypothetical protein
MPDNPTTQPLDAATASAYARFQASVNNAQSATTEKEREAWMKQAYSDYDKMKSGYQADIKSWDAEDRTDYRQETQRLKLQLDAMRKQRAAVLPDPVKIKLRETALDNIRQAFANGQTPDPKSIAAISKSANDDANVVGYGQNAPNMSEADRTSAYQKALMGIRAEGGSAAPTSQETELQQQIAGLKPTMSHPKQREAIAQLLAPENKQSQIQQIMASFSPASSNRPVMGESMGSIPGVSQVATGQGQVAGTITGSGGGKGATNYAVPTYHETPTAASTSALQEINQFNATPGHRAMQPSPVDLAGMVAKYAPATPDVGGIADKVGDLSGQKMIEDHLAAALPDDIKKKQAMTHAERQADFLNIDKSAGVPPGTTAKIWSKHYPSPAATKPTGGTVPAPAGSEKPLGQRGPSLDELARQYVSDPAYKNPDTAGVEELGKFRGTHDAGFSGYSSARVPSEKQNEQLAFRILNKSPGRSALYQKVTPGYPTYDPDTAHQTAFQNAMQQQVEALGAAGQDVLHNRKVKENDAVDAVIRANTIPGSQ